jgi:hypothetical protein
LHIIINSKCAVHFSVSIAVDHGANGVMDLIRSLAALARSNLNDCIKEKYPHLNDLFYYAGSACTLAASIALSANISVIKELEAIPASITTLRSFKSDFLADKNRSGRDKK